MKSEFHSIPWVSRRPRYDKTTLLHYNSREEKREVFWCALEWRGGGLYSSGGENMNERSFSEGWQELKKKKKLT